MDDDFLTRVKSILEKAPSSDYGADRELLASEVSAPSAALNATGRPFITDPKQLSEPKVLEEFSYIVKEIIRLDNVEQAIKSRQLLEDTLLAGYPQLATEAPEIYEQYQELVILLKFIALSTRPLPDAENLLQDNLRLALKAGIDIQSKFQEVLDKYDDILLEGKIAQSLANALISSSSRLGTESIRLRGTDRPVSPTTGNFIRDYHQSTLPPPGQEKKVGSVERITYINQSPNVRKLTKEDRDLLLKALELYDWLRFGSNPITIGLEDQLKYVVREKIILPPPPLPPSASGRRPPQSGTSPTPSPPPSLPPQGGGIRGVERVPRTTALNEDLYRETLEELARERAEAEKLIRHPSTRSAGLRVASSGVETATSSGPAAAPSGGKPPIAVEGKPMSVNEAIIQAGQKEPPADHGQVTAGEKEVEEKLKKLEDKLK